METVGPLADLPDGDSFLFRAGALQIALFRRGEVVHALDDICPHAGASLCSGFSDGQIVVCPWHGWEFDLATGKGLSVAGTDAEAFRVVIEDGIVSVEIPE